MARSESGHEHFKPKINTIEPNNMRLTFLILTFLFITSIGESRSSFFFQSPKKNSSFVNTSISKEAESRVGMSFRSGSYAMCAAFVADVVKESGGTVPSNPNLARNWLKWGKPVSLSTIKKGDIIVCWRGSRYGSKGHILIYVGDGMCVHRSTRSSPIKKIQLSYYRNKILGVRRYN
jgi:cell wall-associated NlpC family hydrolase